MLTQEQLKDYEDKGGHLILFSRFVTLALEFVNSCNQYRNPVDGLLVYHEGKKCPISSYLISIANGEALFQDTAGWVTVTGSQKLCLGSDNRPNIVSRKALQEH